MRIDYTATSAIVRGIAIDLAGKALGWLMVLAGLWVAVAVIVGSVHLAEMIGEQLP